MGDLSYWITVLETSGWFILWTLVCAGLVAGLEFVGRRLFRHFRGARTPSPS
jgi:hypothetical protein